MLRSNTAHLYSEDKSAESPPKQRSRLCGQTAHSPITTKKGEKLSFLSFSTQSRGRTGTGVNLLVFETSASTDSAIWASDFSEMVCKYTHFFLTTKIFDVIFLFISLLLSDSVEGAH